MISMVRFFFFCSFNTNPKVRNNLLNNQSGFLPKLSNMATNRDLFILSIFLMLYIAEVQARRGISSWFYCFKSRSKCTSVEIALLVTAFVLVVFCSCAGACFKEKIKMISINLFRSRTQGITIASISFVELSMYFSNFIIFFYSFNFICVCLIKILCSTQNMKVAIQISRHPV